MKIAIEAGAQKTKLGETYVDVAKTAIRKLWDFEKLKYSDDTYGENEGVIDAIYELVIECREIGNVAFNAKYGATQAPAPGEKVMTIENELAAANELNAELLKKIARLSPPSPKSPHGTYLEYVYSAGCSSAHAQSTAITCHLQYSEGYPADDVNPAEPARMDLCHAYIGGVDIINTLLDEAKIKIIEQDALEDYMRGEL